MKPDRRSGHAGQVHTDVSFGDECPKISVLRGVVIPPDDRDTVWLSAAAAYLDLPEPLRMLADNLWAVHCSTYDCTLTRHSAELGASNLVMSSPEPSARTRVRLFASIPRRASACSCSESP